MSATRLPNILIDQKEALSSYLTDLLEDSLPRESSEPQVLSSVGGNNNLANAYDDKRLPFRKDLGQTSVNSSQKHPFEADDSQYEHLNYFMFKVRGVALALPLEKVNGVLDWPGELTIKPSHQGWTLGYVACWGLSTKIVDTAELVLPDMSSINPSSQDSAKYEKIILINEGNWGLACNGGEILKISSGDVRWRSTQTQRPWLAGTNLKQRCALLDAGELVKLLAAKGVSH